MEIERYAVWINAEKSEEFRDLCNTDLVIDYDFEDTFEED